MDAGTTRTKPASTGQTPSVSTAPPQGCEHSRPIAAAPGLRHDASAGVCCMPPSFRTQVSSKQHTAHSIQHTAHRGGWWHCGQVAGQQLPPVYTQSYTVRRSDGKTDIRLQLGRWERTKLRQAGLARRVPISTLPQAGAYDLRLLLVVLLWSSAYLVELLVLLVCTSS